jgi:hypothetical protein
MINSSIKSVYLGSLILLGLLSGLPLWAKPENKAVSSQSAVVAAPLKTMADKPFASKQKPDKPTEASAITPENLNELDAKTRQDLTGFNQHMLEENQSVVNELRDEQEVATKDMAVLWQAAVERSSTIRYAIEKLSRRDSTGKPVQGDPFTTRILQSLARVGGVAGSIMTGSPAGILGGNMVNQLLQSDPGSTLQNRVTDVDMLILVKEIESLQTKILEQYYTYRHAQQQLKQAEEANQSMEKIYQKLKLGTTTDALESYQSLVDTLLNQAQQEMQQAKQNYLSSRGGLALMVGPDALSVIEHPDGIN